MVTIAVVFVVWKSRQPKSNASSTVVRKGFHLLALAIYIPGVIYEPYVMHLASSVATAAFIFIEVCMMLIIYIDLAKLKAELSGYLFLQ